MSRDDFWRAASFFSKGAAQLELIARAQEGDAQRVRRLLDTGAHKGDLKMGPTAVYQAIYREHLDVLDVLFDDKYKKDIGITKEEALATAIEVRSDTVVKALLAMGADADHEQGKLVKLAEDKSTLKIANMVRRRAAQQREARKGPLDKFKF